MTWPWGGRDRGGTELIATAEIESTKAPCLGLGNTRMTSQNASLSRKLKSIYHLGLVPCLCFLTFPVPNWECSYLLMAQQLSGLGKDIEHHSQLHSVSGPFPPSIMLALPVSFSKQLSSLHQPLPHALLLCKAPNASPCIGSTQ